MINQEGAGFSVLSEIFKLGHNLASKGTDASTCPVKLYKSTNCLG